MTKRGRPPREDGRRTIATRIAATPTEEKLINKSYTTDEKRQAIMAWDDVKALVEAVGNIVTELGTNAAPYKIDAALRLVRDQVALDVTLLIPLVLAYEPFDDVIPLHESV